MNFTDQEIQAVQMEVWGEINGAMGNIKHSLKRHLADADLLAALALLDKAAQHFWNYANRETKQ